MALPSDEREYWEGVTRPYGDYQEEDARLRQCTHCYGIVKSPDWQRVVASDLGFGHDASCRHLTRWSVLESNGATTEPPPGGGGGTTPLLWSRGDVNWSTAVLWSTTNY